jgi:hypothetical protein
VTFKQRIVAKMQRISSHCQAALTLSITMSAFSSKARFGKPSPHFATAIRARRAVEKESGVISQV